MIEHIKHALCQLRGGHRFALFGLTPDHIDPATHVRLVCSRCGYQTRWFGLAEEPGLAQMQETILSPEQAEKLKQADVARLQALWAGTMFVPVQRDRYEALSILNGETILPVKQAEALRAKLVKPMSPDETRDMMEYCRCNGIMLHEPEKKPAYFRRIDGVLMCLLPDGSLVPAQEQYPIKDPQPEAPKGQDGEQGKPGDSGKA